MLLQQCTRFTDHRNITSHHHHQEVIKFRFPENVVIQKHPLNSNHEPPDFEQKR